MVSSAFDVKSSKEQYRELLVKGVDELNCKNCSARPINFI